MISTSMQRAASTVCHVVKMALARANVSIRYWFHVINVSLHLNQVKRTTPLTVSTGPVAEAKAEAIL